MENETKNHRFYLVPDEWGRMDDPDIKDEPIPQEELVQLRAEAVEKLGEQSLRSCWECNPAHYHFLNREDMFLCCFSCGRFYYKGVDVTEYEDKEE